ncbi:division/cell wall cluster transcriptional repressor MraZ [Helicovermis profundi]|uniref:Transcriptional regulator MraZ n=1 Tax=Helicovermis profundi TaxID=3065157 RepID=A0AAU9E4C6_9FIRM|nr:division/cell wall cluster transcriptional repressor MraZ [Clostridia bacterium S502]
MFIGEFNHTIDSKGRINIPSKFREELNKPFYVTKGLDNCLFIFPESEWNVFEEKLKALPLTNKNARAFVRLFFSGASEVNFDKQGRIMISKPLREHGKLEKEVKVIGVGTRIEIWSNENWLEYNSPDNISYDEIAEQMAELGI